MAAYLPRVVDEELDALLPALPALLLECRRLSSVTLSWARPRGKASFSARFALRALLHHFARGRGTGISAGSHDAYPLSKQSARNTTRLSGAVTPSDRSPSSCPEVYGPKGVGKTATALRRPSLIHRLDDAGQRAVVAAQPARATHSGAGRIVTVRMRPLTLAERGVGEPTVSGDCRLRLSRPPYAVHRRVRNPAALRRWLTAYAATTSTTASYETIRDAATSRAPVGATEAPPRRSGARRPVARRGRRRAA